MNSSINPFNAFDWRQRPPNPALVKSDAGFRHVRRKLRSLGDGLATVPSLETQSVSPVEHHAEAALAFARYQKLRKASI